MSALTMLVALVTGALAQVMLPAWNFAGRAVAPIVLAVVLYYALYYPPPYLWTAAILGGLIQDALDLVPLGYSAVCFLVIALMATRFREVMFLHEFWSHVWIGGLASAGCTLVMAALLNGADQLEAAFGWIVLRACGSLVLGAVCAPAVMSLMTTVDRTLGNEKMREP